MLFPHIGPCLFILKKTLYFYMSIVYQMKNQNSSLLFLILILLLGFKFTQGFGLKNGEFQIDNLSIPCSTGNSIPDTLLIQVSCNSTGSDTLVINNSGLSNLTYYLTTSQPKNNVVINEDFESGLITFQNLSANTLFKSIVTNSTAPSGNSYLEVTGKNNFQKGLYKKLNTTWPDYISYWTSSDTITQHHSRVAFGNRQATNNFSFLFYSSFLTNELRIWDGTFSPPTGWDYIQTRNTGQWYHIEYKNFDWVNKSFDLFVDDTLRLAGALLANQPSNGLSEISLGNSSYATFGFDHLIVESKDVIRSLSYTPYSGNISSGMSNDIVFYFNATNWNVGTYWVDLHLTSNDTCLDGKTIALKIEVIGDAIHNQSALCLDFGDVYNGHSYKDSILIWNSGCDTLIYSSVQSSNAEIATNFSQLSLLPGDEAHCILSLTPNSLGGQMDTIFFSGPSGDTFICVDRNSFDAPIISSDSLSYHVLDNSCQDSVCFPIKIYNNGSANLSWFVDTITEYVIKDNFEAAQINQDLWAYVGSGISLDNYCGEILGNQSLRFGNGNNRKIETRGVDVSHGGTISFVYKMGTCPINGTVQSLNLEYSTNNGTNWSYIGVYGSLSPNPTTINALIPLAAYGSNTKFRFTQTYFSNNTNYWLIDDFILEGKRPNNIISNNQTMNLAPGDSSTFLAKIDLNGKTNGTYDLIGSIASNDPELPFLLFPIKLRVIPRPLAELGGGCVTFDSTKSQLSTLDSVLIKNVGCAPLTMSNYQLPRPIFKTLTGPTIIWPDDSVYVKIVFEPDSILGLIQDTLTILSNGSDLKICLSGYALGAPNLKVHPNSCLDFGTITSPGIYRDSIQLKNLGNGNLDYANFLFGNSNFSAPSVLPTIGPGDSLWVPITFTSPSLSDSIVTHYLLSSNDSQYTGCVSADVQYSPIASFFYSIEDSCGGNISFSNTSLNDPKQVTWDFGDGSKSHQFNPKHNYSKPGIYPVKFIVSNAGGIDSTVLLINLPQITQGKIYSPNTAPANDPIQFSDSTVNATTWTWSFGDGQGSYLQNPAYSYTVPGIYIVECIVSNIHCRDTSTKTILITSGINIDENPIESFKVYPNPASDILNIEWDETVIVEFKIFNSKGKLVFENHNEIKNQLHLNLNKWPVGLYFLRYKTKANKIGVGKIQIHR